MPNENIFEWYEQESARAATEERFERNMDAAEAETRQDDSEP